MRVNFLSMVGILGLSVLFCASALFAPAEAEPLGASQIMLSGNGACDSISHTAEGPEGSDLTKTDVPFKCDTVVISNFANDESWVLVQFGEKESITGGVLGFSGELDSTGTHISLRHIYFQAGAPLDADAGFCDFIFDGNSLAGISCVGKVDEEGRRAAALVQFHFVPEQSPPSQ